MNKKLSFIGSGNMAEAILKGVLTSKIIAAKNIICSDIDPQRLKTLKKKYKIKTTNKNQEAVTFSDIIILSVKPQQINTIIAEIKDLPLAKKSLISICAGIKLKKIEKILGKVSTIRVMPNSPALIGAGISAISQGAYTSKATLSYTQQIFKSIGEIIKIEEKHMDAVTALSGSGPAYLFYFLEAMIEAGKKLKIKEEQAKKLALETFLGAAKLALSSKHDLKTLRGQVTSKGGTTEAALRTFEKQKLKSAFINGIKAAQKRSKELSK